MDKHNEKNILSGEELKNLITDGKLPDEYIREENIKSLLDYEFERMGDSNKYYDMSVVEYCNDLLCKNYVNADYEKQKSETFEKIKAQIKSKNKTEKRHIPSAKHFRFLYAAASIVIMIFSVQLVSITAFGFDLFDWSKNTVKTFVGIEVRQEDTMYEADGSKEYNSVEELEKDKNIDIMIPTWLPNDIEIETIKYSYQFKERRIEISYNDNLTSLSVILNSALGDVNSIKTYENNNISFYLFENQYLILWEYNGKFYSLNCGFEIDEYAEKIIENIK